MGTDSLQGSIWRCTQSTTNASIVAKVTSKELHSSSSPRESIVKNASNRTVHVLEDIKHEHRILKHLTKDPFCPSCIIRPLAFLESRRNYYLLLEDGGRSLYNFIVEMHDFVDRGYLRTAELHRLVRVIVCRMVECVEYLHARRTCHFDLSLENFLISDELLNVDFDTARGTITFADVESVELKLIDFGLAEKFKDGRCKSSKFCGKVLYQSPEIRAKKKNFDAQKNDIWCLGVMLFNLIVGRSPWQSAETTDRDFTTTMERGGDVTSLVKRLGRTHFVDAEAVQLLRSVFQYEDRRCTLQEIRASAWIRI